MDLVTSTIFEPTVRLDIDIKSLKDKQFDKLHVLGWSEEGVAYEFLRHMILRDDEEHKELHDI